jgi:hypothetical protein
MGGGADCVVPGSADPGNNSASHHITPQCVSRTYCTAICVHQLRLTHPACYCQQPAATGTCTHLHCIMRVQHNRSICLVMLLKFACKDVCKNLSEQVKLLVACLRLLHTFPLFHGSPWHGRCCRVCWAVLHQRYTSFRSLRTCQAKRTHTWLVQVKHGTNTCSVHCAAHAP